MADEIKIIPDPPPAEPFEVQIFPDPEPWTPYDVPIFYDPPPWKPYDVQILLDPDSWLPHDVQINQDPAPWQPVDVSVILDPAPWNPIDVQTVPDPAPWQPVDVQINTDGPPWQPVDVQISTDGPPWQPVDVVITPDLPSWNPIDVPITFDSPPWQPIDVEINPDLPPQFPVSVGGNRAPTLEEIISSIKNLDSTLANFLGTLYDIPLTFISIQGAGALDPIYLAKWFKNYQSSVGVDGIVKFITQQTELYAMNPIVAKVFNFGYFESLLVPGSMGNVHTTIDTMAGITADKIAIEKDKIEYQKISAGLRDKIAGTNADDNAYSEDESYTSGQNFSVDGMVDSILDGKDYQFLKTDGFGNQSRKVYDASQYFNSRDEFGNHKILQKAREKKENLFSSPHTRANAIDGIIRNTLPGEELDGTVLSKTQNPSEIIDDDDTRIPLSFTDLRKDPVKNRYRSVYFKPMNLQFSEAYSPEYNEASSIGRVDPIIGYTRTTRTLNVSFELHAFAPEDLQVMYNKMVWLTSMVYPSFGSDAVMKSGPVVRLRIGDAVATESGGLPGIIKSLNFDFADALWEIQKNRKVPRSFKVSIDFTVLHEGPVGLLNGDFGVFKLPMNSQSTKNTNEGTANDSVDSAPELTTYNPGMFSKFGEPRRK